MKLSKFQKVLLVSVTLVAFFGFMDSLGFKMFSQVGGFGGQVYTTLFNSWMGFFWTFAFALILVVAWVYYLLKHDKSETLALITTPILLLLGGLEDIFYYIFTGFQFFGTTMPWLNNNIFMFTIARIMGQDVVTSSTLLVSVGVSILLAYFTYTKLKKAKW